MTTVLTVYNYDPETFEYCSSEPACRNPLNPEEPIVPACATTEKPLKQKKGYAIIWVGNKWAYKIDHRGEVWFNSNTESLETINFIGELPKNYYTPDSPRANKPEGDYWVYDTENEKWVGNAGLYKLHLKRTFSGYWNIKQSTPFEFEGFYYLPEWRELYMSIWIALSEGLKEEYRLEDAIGNFNIVNKRDMKKIIQKMSDVNDEMYKDKQDLEVKIEQEDNFDVLQDTFNKWLEKTY